MALVKSNVALPTSVRLASAPSKYDLGGLQVGESLIELDIMNAKKAAARLTSALAAYRKRNPSDKRKYSVRSFKHDGADAVGIWCVADPVAVAQD